MNSLFDKIEKIVLEIPFVRIQKAAKELSEAYRLQTEGKKPAGAFMFKEDHRLAYLALRMPATLAAILEVLKNVSGPINSFLDVGSGPGTAFFAASCLFPEMKEALLLEKDAQMIRIGEKLLENKFPYARYQQQDMSALSMTGSFDLVVAAYSLSELSLERKEKALTELWKAAGKFFCIVEPGTPYGFESILAARSWLLQQGGHVVAPCTHERSCPWEAGNPWCHFSTRLGRTSLQKRVKEAALGYEDEKYSYLIVSKEPMEHRDTSRIVKSPEKRSGFLRLTLCNERGIENVILTKKSKEAYLGAKSLEWGDLYGDEE